jgi:hypothetical protein
MEPDLKSGSGGVVESTQVARLDRIGSRIPIVFGMDAKSLIYKLA